MTHFYNYLILVLSTGVVILCLTTMAYLIFHRKKTPAKKGTITFQPTKPREARKTPGYLMTPGYPQRSGIPNSISCRSTQRKRREAERRQP